LSFVLNLNGWFPWVKGGNDAALSILVDDDRRRA
jgi:hypothetical protein